MAGFLIYWILSIRSRDLQFGIFRAMGLSMGGVVAMLTAEQVLVSGSAIAAGIAIGALTSWLYVPLIQMGYAAGAHLPLLVAYEFADYERLMILTAVMLAICMLALISAVRGIRVAQALKLGED
jgi:putative ABC transport system permease protein